MKHDVVAEPAAATDDSPRMDVAVVADHHSRGDVRTGMNVRVPADLSRRTHVSVGRNADLRTDSPRCKSCRDFQKGVLGIIDENEGRRVAGDLEGVSQLAVDQDCRRQPNP